MQLPYVTALEYRHAPRRGQIPHCVLAFELTEYRGPADLVRPCVRVGLIINPLLVAMVTELGGTGDAAGCSVPTRRVAELCARLWPGTLAGVIPEHWVLPTGRRPARLAARVARLAVTAGVRRSRFRVSGAGVTMGRIPLEPFARGVMVTPAQALTLARTVLDDGLAAVECGRAGRLALAWEHAAAFPQAVGHPAPGLSVVRQAELETVCDAEAVLALVDAETEVAELELAGDADGGPDGGERALRPSTVVLDEDAATLAVLAACAEQGRAGLRAHQDLLVERYLAAPAGMLVACAPGTGKTVATLAALAAAGHSAVVAVPSAVREQWRDELARWYPGACVLDADGTPPHQGPWVLVDTWARVVRRAEQLPRRFDALVVDEATILASGSQRARVLAALRGRARHALALTGTPDQSGLAAMGRQLGWALGRDAVALDELVVSTGRSVAELCGPYLVSAETDTMVGTLHWEVLPTHAPGLAELLTEREQALGALLTELHSLEVGRLDARGRAHRRHAAQLRFELGTGLGQYRRVEADPSSVGLVTDRMLRVAERIGDDPAVLCCDHAELAERIARELCGAGISARVLTRDEDQRAFDAGAVQVAVATPRAQRGTNLQRAGLVLHYDLPLGAGQAAQRVGRVARVGGHAEVRSVLCAHDAPGPLQLAACLQAGLSHAAWGWVGELVGASAATPELPVADPRRT